MRHRIGDRLFSTKITLLRSLGPQQKVGKRSIKIGIDEPKHPVTRVKNPNGVEDPSVVGLRCRKPVGGWIKVSETRRRLD